MKCPVCGSHAQACNVGQRLLGGMAAACGGTLCKAFGGNPNAGEAWYKEVCPSHEYKCTNPWCGKEFSVPVIL